MKSQFWTLEEFKAYQLDRLRGLVESASRNSPFYRDKYTHLGVNAGALTKMSDIQQLPIVTKGELREQGHRFVSSAYRRRDLWVADTAGTTGTPIRAYHTHRSMQERTAFLERLYRWYNPEPWRKRASFTGRLVVNPDRTTAPFHRNNLAMRQQLYSSHHLTERNLECYVQELKRFAPDQIEGIASSVYVVAEYITRTGRAGMVKPKVVILSSETLWPHIRERIAGAFQSPVSNQYGSQEGAPCAYECPAGGFHTSPEAGIFEILRPDNTSCAPGELGRLVVTSFESEGTPLIRYDIGDVAAWRPGSCPCGRQMPMLESVEGRIDDMFFTRERGIVPRVDSAFKSLPSSIVAAQVAQIAVNRFEVRILPDGNLYRAEHGLLLVERLRDYLGRSVVIEVKIVPAILRSAGGKMRAMVNECRDPEVRNSIVERWNASNPGSPGSGRYKGIKNGQSEATEFGLDSQHKGTKAGKPLQQREAQNEGTESPPN